MTWATSSTTPSRPVGISAAIAALRSGASRPAVMSVSTRPGATAFTVTPCGPSSRASAREKPSSAALAAE